MADRSKPSLIVNWARPLGLAAALPSACRIACACGVLIACLASGASATMSQTAESVVATNRNVTLGNVTSSSEGTPVEPLMVRVTCSTRWRLTVRDERSASMLSTGVDRMPAERSIEARGQEGSWEQVGALPLVAAAGEPTERLGELVLIPVRAVARFSDTPGNYQRTMRLTLEPANSYVDVVVRWTIDPTLSITQIGEQVVLVPAEMSSRDSVDFLEKTYLVTANVDWRLSLRLSIPFQAERHSGGKPIYVWVPERTAHVELTAEPVIVMTGNPTSESGRVIRVRFGGEDPSQFSAGTYRGEVEAVLSASISPTHAD